MSHGSVSRRTVEVATSALCILVGSIIAIGGLRAGVAWMDDGVPPGFAPFYLGLVLSVASLTNIVRIIVRESDGEKFAQMGDLYRVLTFIGSLAAAVALSTVLGLYVALFAFVAGNLKWRGGYPLATSLGAGLCFVVCAYLIFHVWLGSPLPMGPIESALGLD